MPQKPSKALLKNEPKSEYERLKQLTELETDARNTGYACIAGVDEAGRGPLAGPVVAAACCISEGVFFPGINDSKLLSPNIRRALFEDLTTHEEVQFSFAFVSEQVIDEINILQATLEAMRQAVKKLKKTPDYLLIDGTHLIGEEIPSEKVIRGDRRSQSIAAASIIAKETRDQLMLDYHKQYPEYGFEQHKGYGTKKHREALLKYGPCPIHRRSFAPVNRNNKSLSFRFNAKRLSR